MSSSASVRKEGGRVRAQPHGELVCQLNGEARAGSGMGGRGLPAAGWMGRHTAGTQRCSHGVRRHGAGHAETGRDKRSNRGQATTMKKWAREDEGGGVVLAVGSA